MWSDLLYTDAIDLRLYVNGTLQIQSGYGRLDEKDKI